MTSSDSATCERNPVKLVKMLFFDVNRMFLTVALFLTICFRCRISCAFPWWSQVLCTPCTFFAKIKKLLALFLHNLRQVIPMRNFALNPNPKLRRVYLLYFLRYVQNKKTRFFNCTFFGRQKHLARRRYWKSWRMACCIFSSKVPTNRCSSCGVIAFSDAKMASFPETRAPFLSLQIHDAEQFGTVTRRFYVSFLMLFRVRRSTLAECWYFFEEVRFCAKMASFRADRLVSCTVFAQLRKNEAFSDLWRMIFVISVKFRIDRANIPGNWIRSSYFSRIIFSSGEHVLQM